MNIKRVSPAARRAAGWWGWGACSLLLVAGKGWGYAAGLDAPVLQTETAFICFAVPANCSKPLGFTRSALIVLLIALFLRLSHCCTRALPRRFLKCLWDSEGQQQEDYLNHFGLRHWDLDPSRR